jgi:hypothetical protein
VRRLKFVVNEKKIAIEVLRRPFAKADEKSRVNRNEVMFFVFVFKLAANVATNVWNDFAEMNKINTAHAVSGHFCD